MDCFSIDIVRLVVVIAVDKYLLLKILFNSRTCGYTL